MTLAGREYDVVDLDGTTRRWVILGENEKLGPDWVDVARADGQLSLDAAGGEVFVQHVDAFGEAS